MMGKICERVLICFCFVLAACSSPTVSADLLEELSLGGESLDKNFSNEILTEEFLFSIDSLGIYTSRDSVAGYLCRYGKLPRNYKTKSEARQLYENLGNSFSKWNFNPWETLGVMVGGDVFSNRENLLPERSYRECDVDYSGKNRGTKRLVYADSCIIYYTGDHYSHFTKLR